MASAKFANKTVNHSHSVIWRSKPKPGACLPISLHSSKVVMTLPTSTTNITGLRIIMRGFSLTTESINAWRMILASQSDFRSCLVDIVIPSESLSRVHEQVFQNGAQAQRREKGQRAYNDD